MNDHELQRSRYLEQALALGGGLPTGAVLSHEAAAVLLGLPVYRLPAAVKITRTRGRGFRTSDVHVHVARLRDDDITIAYDVPVTSPARTVLDLARRHPFMEALVVADGALRVGTTRAHLQEKLREQWTWPGVRRAMNVVRHADARSESALESVVRSRFIDLHLPMPELQRNITGEFGWVARVDFEWPDYSVVGEADGRVKYLADELWREKVRQDDIEDAGFEVIRWRWASAHAPQAEFSTRLWRKLRRGLHMRTFHDVG